MKAHSTDGLSLTFGVIFLAIVGWWALAKSVDITLPNLGWFVAGALILLGVLGLLGALRRQASTTVDEPAAVTSAPPYSEPTRSEPTRSEPARDDLMDATDDDTTIDPDRL